MPVRCDLRSRWCGVSGHYDVSNLYKWPPLTANPRHEPTNRQCWQLIDLSARKNGGKRESRCKKKEAQKEGNKCKGHTHMTSFDDDDVDNGVLWWWSSTLSARTLTIEIRLEWKTSAHQPVASCPSWHEININDGNEEEEIYLSATADIFLPVPRNFFFVSKLLMATWRLDHSSFLRS